MVCHKSVWTKAISCLQPWDLLANYRILCYMRGRCTSAKILPVHTTFTFTSDTSYRVVSLEKVTITQYLSSMLISFRSHATFAPEFMLTVSANGEQIYLLYSPPQSPDCTVNNKSFELSRPMYSQGKNDQVINLGTGAGEEIVFNQPIDYLTNNRGPSEQSPEG